MSKEERFIYHCDNYDYADIIYDTKEYQECDSMQMATNWLNRQDQKIAALNTKLADNIALLEGLRKSEEEKKHIAMKRVYELKQQLAEKEKEIDNLQDKLHHYYEETLNNGTCGLCEHLRNEYKTDFAIEQLEKVKEYIHGKYLDETWHNKIVDEDREDTHDFIDNLIKELKKGK